MLSHKPLDPDYRTRVKSSFSRQKFMDFIGAEIIDLEPGYCEIQLPYREELSQQHGFFHAGIIGTLADNSGGYAGFTLLPPNASTLTVEYKLNLIAPALGERLIAKAKVLRAGRTLITCRPEVFVEKEGSRKLCAAALMTLIVLKDRSDSPDGAGDK